ncbi:hypothetical protein [Rhizobium leguminosarum]|uniref:hypothetical protein n=1 Tax=Rhizobium leguminosarum TaxID=384 RepID=UPI001C952454|nr:hypothetical protein [Rhizobium leguminosarum]MBY5797682.1 hypothetical protein [Rhizobium leguminosarum]
MPLEIIFITGVEAEDYASFDLVAFGPLYDEVEEREGLSRVDLMALHKPTRDIVGTLEKALAQELKAVGYNALNTVASKHSRDIEGWRVVRHAFSQRFPKLSSSSIAACVNGTT